ncbi:hypothetical protein Q2T42_07100 [Leptolyngbya boryana CZ1]|uniref:Uncharacterized protein n=1 Tax=Leptolyngbya boryana CZ1 TaxID=3060204 RepID=A0AA96WXA2_LEPBY|nr:hypothetical protein [Leptolyngbya boryana]WNZ47596.1 hypothetical protein Q2T42_07100 [Leptolyngbya boryana CZ1]
MKYFDWNSYLRSRRQAIDKQIEDLQRERSEINQNLGETSYVPPVLHPPFDINDVLHGRSASIFPPRVTPRWVDISTQTEKPLWDDQAVYCVNQKGERSAVWVGAPSEVRRNRKATTPTSVEKSEPSTSIQRVTPTSQPQTPPYKVVLGVIGLLIALGFFMCQGNNQPPNNTPNPNQSAPTQPD